MKAALGYRIRQTNRIRSYLPRPFFRARKISVSRTYLWFSPTLCGCVLERTDEWIITPELQERLAHYYVDDPEMAELWIRYIVENSQYDVVNTTYTIKRQCWYHDAEPDAASLAAHLLQFTQPTHSPDSCKCTIVAFGERASPDAPLKPIFHPVNTKFCPLHAHLADDPIAHYHAVKAHNVVKSMACNAAAELHGIPASSVPFKMDPEGNCVIDHVGCEKVKAEERERMSQLAKAILPFLDEECARREREAVNG